ncbi:hypothetical protein M595_3559 [Lyngbya aestuarii BL J]|uniref:Uncharacterized protein n=1 Tax=Lyngbya aestuarii BL J TaxID=1348334 RepID=U7QHD7_9CYAN|nr:hypothetical protein M595_3559 [Lyngbya aestuarii BL J]
MFQSPCGEFSFGKDLGGEGASDSFFPCFNPLAGNLALESLDLAIQ